MSCALVLRTRPAVLQPAYQGESLKALTFWLLVRTCRPKSRPVYGRVLRTTRPTGPPRPATLAGRSIITTRSPDERPARRAEASHRGDAAQEEPAPRPQDAAQPDHRLRRNAGGGRAGRWSGRERRDASQDQRRRPQ